MPVSDDVKALLDNIESSQRTLIFEQEAEIARLRLTDAEREAVHGAILFMEARGVWAWPATLRELLDRLGGNADAVS